MADPSGRSGPCREFINTFPAGARKRWANAAGTTEANISVNATHTHSAPAAYATTAYLVIKGSRIFRSDIMNTITISGRIRRLRNKYDPIFRVGGRTTYKGSKTIYQFVKR